MVDSGPTGQQACKAREMQVHTPQQGGDVGLVRPWGGIGCLQCGNCGKLCCRVAELAERFWCWHEKELDCHCAAALVPEGRGLASLPEGSFHPAGKQTGICARGSDGVLTQGLPALQGLQQTMSHIHTAGLR